MSISFLIKLVKKYNILFGLFLIGLSAIVIVRFPFTIPFFLLTIILILLGKRNPPKIAVLSISVLFLLFFVLILFPIDAEIGSEIQVYYVSFLERGDSIDNIIWTIRNYFANEPGFFYLSSFINRAVEEPFFSIEIIRLFLTVLGFLLVYILGKEIFKKESIALLAAFIFAFHYQQIFYLGGDQFKNFLGNIFFIGTILFFVKSFENKKKLIPTIFLWLASVFCHKVYLFFFPLVILAFLITKFFSYTLKFKHILAPILAGIVTFYLLMGSIILVLETSFIKIPRLADYWGHIEGRPPPDLGALIPEFTHLGILLFNIWGALLIIGAMVFYKKEILINKKILFIFVLFVFNFLMAKNYLLGFPFIHGRFALLIPVSQALLTALFIYKITEHKRGLVLRLPLIALVILANFLVLVRATGGEIVNVLFLSLNSFWGYISGNFTAEMTISNVLFFFLIAGTFFSGYFFIGKGLFKETGIKALVLGLALIIMIGVFSWWLHINNFIPLFLSYLMPLIISLLFLPIYFMRNIKKYEFVKN